MGIRACFWSLKWNPVNIIYQYRQRFLNNLLRLRMSCLINKPIYKLATWFITMFAWHMARAGNSVTVVDAVHRKVADDRNCTGTYDNSTTRAYLSETIFLEPARYDFDPELDRHVHPAACCCRGG